MIRTNLKTSAPPSPMMPYYGNPPIHFRRLSSAALSQASIYINRSPGMLGTGAWEDELIAV